MRLLLRHFASSVGASILVAVVVLAVTAVVALVPRAVSVMTTAELRYQLDSVSDELRDPVSETVGGIPTFTSDTDPYAQMDDALAGIRSQASDRLRSLLGDPQYFSRSEAILTPDATPDRDAPLTQTRVAFDPRIESRVSVVDGALPAVWDGEGATPFEIMLSQQTADQERWEIGEVRTVQSGVRIALSGIFAANDPDDRYWKHAESVLVPELLDDGNSTPQVTGVGYANPLSLGLFFGTASRTTVWFPIDADTLDFADAAALAPELRSFTTTAFPLPRSEFTPPQSLRFESAAVAVLDSVLAKAATTVAVLAMIASGPLGVVLAVLGLGARSVVERRRAALALASARGASGFQVRGAMALEGLLLGVIPAALGVGLSFLVPARVGPEAFIAPVLIGLAPAALFAASASPQGLRATRADLGGAGRFRWILEMLVLLLAVAAVVLLLRRGLATSATSVGVDPLLAATPLLLSLAVCVIVLRLYPVPLLALARRLRARPGLSGFLGATRAVRDRSLALAAVLALVVGVSVSVFSSVLLTTVDRGVSAGAAAAVGADLRAEGPVFSPEAIAAASGLPGVDAVAGIDVAAPAALRVDKVRTTVRLFVADTAALSAIRDLPAGLDTLDAGAIPMVVSSDLASGIDSGSALLLEGKDATVAAVQDRTTGFGDTGSWVIIDSAFAEQVTGNRFLPRLVLLDTEPGVDPDTLAQALVDLGGPSTTVTGIAEAEAAARSAPTTAGFRTALTLAILAIVLLAALAVIMSSAIGAESRNRILAMLRTLGVSSRQTTALVAWELAPLAVVALIAGTALGLALPWVVLAGVDLRPFTGGQQQPSPEVDPLLLAAVLGGVILTVIAAGVVSIVIARRRDPASTLRMGAE